MNCKKCGSEIAEGFNDCPQCGESVNGKTKAKKPIVKKWWFWLITAVVLIGIIGSLGSSGDTEPTTTERETIAVADDATVTGTDDTTESTTPSNVYNVGEIFNDGGLKIAFVSAEKWTGYNQYMGPESGNMIVRYYFEVENTSDTDRSVTTFDFSAYADGQATTQRYFDDDISLTLSAGRKGNGYVYFEVPETAELVEVEYEFDWWNDSKIIFAAEF